ERFPAIPVTPMCMLACGTPGGRRGWRVEQAAPVVTMATGAAAGHPPRRRRRPSPGRRPSRRRPGPSSPFARGAFAIMTGKLLARYPLFRLLSPRQLHDWLAAGQEIDCPSGFTLFQENTPGAWAHLVLDGRVRIVRQSGRREVSLGMMLPGDVFGEYALLPPGNNTATCRTAAPSRLLRLPLAPLQTALQEQHPVWKNLKNWLRLHTLLHFHRERTFLGFMSGESALKLNDRLRPAAFAAGQTIQANGLAADCWYLLEQGTGR